MKKIFLVILGLLMCFLGFSQDFVRIIKITKLNFYEHKWVTVDTKYPSDLFIIIKDWDITIGTYKLKTYDNPQKTIYDTHTTYSWKCVDSDGNSCYFMMKKLRSDITSHTLFSVVYEKYLLMYEYESD